jgi:hypothetical protein
MRQPSLILSLLLVLACTKRDQTVIVDSQLPDTTTTALVPVDSGAMKLLPRDEANESFKAFRREALAALARRDTAFLYGILSPVIKNSFGGDDSVSGFKRVWKPEESNSAVWSHLARVLSMGGKLESDSMFTAPYVYAFWPDSIDSFDYVATTDSPAVVRSDSSATAPAIGAASYSIGKVLGWSSFPSAQLPADSTWARVQFPNGSSGWIRGTSVYSPVSWRAMFQRQNGRWTMIFFVAGD